MGKMLYCIKDFVTNSTVKKHKNQIILYKGDILDKQPWDLENSNVSGTLSSHSPTPSTSATREASVPRAEADERGDDRVTDSPVNSGSPQPATDGQQRSPPRPSWVTTTRGVRRPPETDVEDECFHDAEASQQQRDEVQPYQSAPSAREKRNRPKVDFKKYF
ncbi:unnamed protein product [Colias eurytheme]|nr:unnamed protein product [Colias eurytheme]